MDASRSFLRGGALLSGSKFWSLFIGYLISLFLARSLGPELFGLFAVIYTLVQWTELVVAQGIPLWLTRTVAASPGSPPLPGVYLGAQAMTAVVLMAILILAAPVAAVVFNAAGEEALFRIASLDIPLFALYNLFLGILLGRQLYGAYTGSAVGFSGVRLIFTIALVMSGLSVAGAVLGTVLASATALVIALALTLRSLGSTPLFGPPPAGTTVRAALAGSGSPALLLTLQTLMLNLDLWLVRALLPEAEAGFYRAAALIAQIPVDLTLGLTFALYASYSDAFSQGKLEQCRRFLRQTTRILMAAGALWVAVVAPTAATVLSLLFSPQYAAGFAVLQVLSVGYAIGNLGTALAPTLLVEKRYGVLLIAATAVFAIEPIGAVLMIPAYGAVGAAYAAAAAFTAAAALALLYIRPFTAGEFTTRLAQLGLPALAVGVAATLIATPEPWMLIVLYPALAAAYGGLIYLTKGMDRQDLATLLGRPA